MKRSVFLEKNVDWNWLSTEHEWMYVLRRTTVLIPKMVRSAQRHNKKTSRMCSRDLPAMLSLSYVFHVSRCGRFCSIQCWKHGEKDQNLIGWESIPGESHFSISNPRAPVRSARCNVAVMQYSKLIPGTGGTGRLGRTVNRVRRSWVMTGDHRDPDT